MNNEDVERHVKISKIFYTWDSTLRQILIRLEIIKGYEHYLPIFKEELKDIHTTLGALNDKIAKLDLDVGMYAMDKHLEGTGEE